MKPNYTKSIVNIPATFLRHYNLATEHPSLPVIERLLGSYKHTVLIVLDGFGMNLLEHLEDDAFLKQYLVDTLDSTFPSTTVAATTALLSGLTPYESGHVGWQQYLEDVDTHYAVFLDEDFYHSKKVVDPSLKSRFTYKRALDRIQSVHPEVATHYFFPKPIDKDGYDTLSDGLKRYMKYQSVRHKSLAYVYSTEPDKTEHFYGVEAEETKRLVRALNQTITDFVKALNDDTLVLITADHGLVDVTPVPVFRHKNFTELLRANPAIEPRACAFFVKPGKEDLFERRFNEYYGDDFTLYKSDMIIKMGLLGYGQKHPLIDLVLGDYMAVAKGDKYFGLTFDESDAFKAHHAGLSDEEMEVPLIIYAPKGLI